MDSMRSITGEAAAEVGVGSIVVDGAVEAGSEGSGAVRAAVIAVVEALGVIVAGRAGIGAVGGVGLGANAVVARARNELTSVDISNGQ